MTKFVKFRTGFAGTLVAYCHCNWTAAGADDAVRENARRHELEHIIEGQQ